MLLVTQSSLLLFSNQLSGPPESCLFVLLFVQNSSNDLVATGMHARTDRSKGRVKNQTNGFCFCWFCRKS
jgi:hypothetical protein